MGFVVRFITRYHNSVFPVVSSSPFSSCTLFTPSKVGYHTSVDVGYYTKYKSKWAHMPPLYIRFESFN
jgi:hypothetical protein